MNSTLMKVFCLVVVTFVAAGRCPHLAMGAEFIQAVVSQESLLLSDSSPDSSQLGFLEKGDSLSVFPEMSTENYFFVMAASGTCEDSYGWVPATTVMFSDERYTDVPRNHWARDAIANLAEEGIMEGADGSFNGNGTVSRYELATVLDRHLKKFQAYKSAVQKSLESMPVNRSLSDSEATRMTQLIRHLEGIELTENSLKSSYAKLEKRINNTQRRVDVVEEMSFNNSEMLAKVQTQVNGHGQKIAMVESRVSQIHAMEDRMNTVMDTVNNLQKSVQSHSASPSAFYEEQQKELLRQIDMLSQRVRTLEEGDEMVVASAQVPLVQEQSEDEEFNFDGFEEAEDEEAFGESFEQVEPEVNLNTTVTKAHSALKEALNKGLVITRHPLDVENDKAPEVKSSPGEPNRVLVRALTRQIAEISSSLNSVGNRIEDIERGVL